MGTFRGHDSERSIRGRASFAAAGTVLALLVGVRPGAADVQPTPDLAKETGLVQRLRALVEEAALGEGVGVSVADARTGRVVFAHQADRPLNPASNQKLLTAAVLLGELGAEHRLLTGLYGEVVDGAVVSGLYLKGYGDPTLGDAELVGLASQLAARGVREVDEVVVDGSYFDDRVLPPGFERQPDETSAFRAAVAAVSVNANAFTLRVTPGAHAGAPARVWVDAEGHFTLQNELATTEGGATTVIAAQRQKDDKLALKVSGKLPAGSPSLVYRRRVESPLHYAGYALVEALRAQRVQVPRRVRLAKLPAGMALLASRKSPPLGNVLYALGKQSDNFTAEMLLKVLAAERVGVPGSTANGARLMLQVVQKLGVGTGGMRIENGSGLFAANRTTAGQLTELLHAMYRRADLRPEFVAHLAVGGVDGTLAERFEQLPSPRVVRAKTGTLADVIALSGYVLGRTPERVFAFSVLTNGVTGKGAQARALADQIATSIAFHLWTADKPLPEVRKAR